jgi:hypothetical protein
MIPAAKNPWVEGWSRRYARRYLGSAFHRVLLDGALPPRPEGPVLVSINHSSWWDLLAGFWLSTDVLGWDGYAPMDERQLRRYPILRRLGVFGVDRESLRGGREFLQHACELLEGRPRALWITPQGALVSTDVRPVRFYSGVARLARLLGRCHLLTVALQYEFWDDRRPELLVSFGELHCLETGHPPDTRSLTRRLEGEMEAQLDHLDRLRRRRDPGLFRELLHRPGGISPTYDRLRAASAVLKGERAPLEHGAVPTPPRWGPAGRRSR